MRRPGRAPAPPAAARRPRATPPAGSRSSASPTSSSTSATRHVRAARSADVIRSPNSTLPATSRCGNSAYSWNIRPKCRSCGGDIGEIARRPSGCARRRAAAAPRPRAERGLAPAARPEDRHRLRRSQTRDRRRRARRRHRTARLRPRPRSITARRGRAPAPARSRARPTAVTTIRIVDIAIAWSTLISPGRAKNREIAIGMVGQSGRATNSVAPNSPSDTAAAKPAATANARAAIGRSTSRQTRRGGAPSTVAASRRRGSIAAQRGHDRPDHERDRDHRLRDRHEERRRRPAAGGVLERDEEAESDGHRRRAERQHQQGIHRARRAARAGTRSRPTPARPRPARSRSRSRRTRASSAPRPTARRTACRSTRSTRARGTTPDDQWPPMRSDRQTKHQRAAHRGTAIVAPSSPPTTSLSRPRGRRAVSRAADEPLRDRAALLHARQHEQHAPPPRRSARARARPPCGGRTARPPGGRSRPRASRARDRQSSSTTPNAVNVNRNTIDAAAMIGGPSSGSVTSRNARARDAPSIRAASSRRGSRFAQNPPTVRTTTATLKNTSATSIGADAPLPAQERERAARPEQHEERRRDHHRRQHERHRHERAEQPPAGELVAGDDVGGRAGRPPA